MKSVRYCDVSTLPVGTILLVDTEDACFKLYVGADITWIHYLEHDETESIYGRLGNRNLIIGEPIGCVTETFNTAPITVIEIYSDE